MACDGEGLVAKPGAGTLTAAVQAVMDLQPLGYAAPCEFQSGNIFAAGVAVDLVMLAGVTEAAV